MQKLEILNARIRGVEKQMNNSRRTLPSHQWEDLVRELKTLNEKKDALNREIRRLS
jgi:predicted  nucleic acid-binding Zn-ribbon protein